MILNSPASLPPQSKMVPSCQCYASSCHCQHSAAITRLCHCQHSAAIKRLCHCQHSAAIKRLCHCERSAAISYEKCNHFMRLLLRSTHRNDTGKILLHSVGNETGKGFPCFSATALLLPTAKQRLSLNDWARATGYP